MKMSFVNMNDLLRGELSSDEIVNNIFNQLENQLLDRKEISLNFKDVNFVSVYCLERLDMFVSRAKDLKVEIKISNIIPSIYKVFQVARLKSVLMACV